MQQDTTFKDFFDDQIIHITVDEFWGTDLHKYLEIMYGKLIYTEEPAANFINVTKDSISEAIYCRADSLKEEDIVGTIIPEALHKAIPVKENCDGGRHLFRRMISKMGAFRCALQDIEIAQDIDELIDRTPFSSIKTENRFAAWYDDLLEHSSDTKPIPRDYIQIGQSILRYCDMAENFSQGNILFQTLRETPIALQDYWEGAHMVNHNDIFDSSFLCFFTWAIKEPFESGREFVLSYMKDYAEIYKPFIEDYKNQDHSRIINAEHTQLGLIKPGADHVLFLNNFNPKFTHRVTPMVGDGRCITIGGHITCPELESIKDKRLEHMVW